MEKLKNRKQKVVFNFLFGNGPGHIRNRPGYLGNSPGELRNSPANLKELENKEANAAHNQCPISFWEIAKHAGHV